MKVYSRGKWVGDTTQFDGGELREGGKYSGTFLVSEDGPNYLGAIMFSVSGGKISGKCAKWYWEFNDRDLVPSELF